MTQPKHNLLQPGEPSRRDFVRGSLALAAGALVGLPGCGGGDDDVPVRFAQGVASGDPLADRMILWTRVVAEDATDLRDIPLRWEVAGDAGFAGIVAGGTARASAASDFCVKVDATGLRPGQRYWYRFVAYGRSSPVGRAKTLPDANVGQVKLAVLSCSNYPTGYFNVYADLARRAEAESIDVALHLGDYIYEYGPGGYASGNAQALGRVVDPAQETVALADYRRRYAQYRGDADLQALHAALPMIAVWDDHEIANDTWKNGAQNHSPATEGEFAARKAAALQAFHEWMPIRSSGSGTDLQQIYRSFAFGKLLALHMLDTRVIGRDQQLDYADYLGAGGFNATAFAADMARSERQLLGAAQSQWLQQQLAGSTATWQLLGQQVLMGRMDIPAPILFEANAPGSGVTVSAYAAIVAKAQSNPASLTPQEQAVLAQPAIPYNLDAWDGYAVARETLLASARQLDKNLVVLAGDTHNAWASDLQDMAGNPVGVEFATSSVTSPGFEDYLPNENPQALAAALTQLIGPLQYCDTSRRGYMVLTATSAECRCDWIFVSGIASRDFTATLAKSLKVLPGAAQRRLVAA
ncbi:MAG TPA: alkaline phosphatase D family protein [Roseateles sp.]|nr:alkaline phosphatase D family protein [Roseateles sp.]